MKMFWLVLLVLKFVINIWVVICDKFGIFDMKCFNVWMIDIDKC